jgi:hypothetical protein
MRLPAQRAGRTLEEKPLPIARLETPEWQTQTTSIPERFIQVRLKMDDPSPSHLYDIAIPFTFGRLGQDTEGNGPVDFGNLLRPF